MIRRNRITIFLMMLSVSGMIVSMVILLILTRAYASDQYHNLSAFTDHIVAKYPQEEQELVQWIKENALHDRTQDLKENTILSTYGYSGKTFESKYYRILSGSFGILIPLVFLFLFLLLVHVKSRYRAGIRGVTDYLEKMNQDKATVLPLHKEDEFSRLEDELYKTMTKLTITKETAVKEHHDLAQSLADISHQIKTPVSSISLMTQLLVGEENDTYIQRISKQSLHLERLVNALLTLARIDAGVLPLGRTRVNVFTMLQVSVDEMEVLIRQKQIHVILPNDPEICYEGDLEWSVEALTNLVKNCAEHTPEGGSITFSYHQNPLYTQIQIEDSGEGFAQKDLPHLFERFYRGNTGKDGAGIGLSLSKALIEQQNGVIRAGNHAGGGACFEIRFYCH